MPVLVYDCGYLYDEIVKLMSRSLILFMYNIRFC